MTLVEVLVALAVSLLGLALAWSFYGETRRAIQRTEDRVARQQGARVALARMRADLAAAGHRIRPDDDPRRPDEAIEAAWRSALVVRADLDGETSAGRQPEEELAERGIFATVTTANDEIVGWVLGGAGARDTLEFAADVAGRTRDGRVEVVRLRRIASRPELRPHTLYRLTLDEEGRPVKVPVLDDVLDLRFHYLDRAARELSPPGGQESSRARRERATIRCIQVELVVAMQRSLETVADAGARGDPAHTRNALRLEAEIWPWNLGRGPHPGSS